MWNFHDGYFEGVLVARDKTVRLFLQTLEKKLCLVVLRGVKALRISNVREGNIILDLKVLDSQQLSETDIPMVYDISEQAESEQIEQLFVSARKACLKMLQMTSSYGAECFALCESVEFAERTQEALEED